jgi:hypothetical protein
MGGTMGVELVELVKERVEREGLSLFGHSGVPTPLGAAALDSLRFPNGAALSPALRAWLAFDASYLGWFDDLDSPTFSACTIGELGSRLYAGRSAADQLPHLAETLPGDCFLLPLRKSARRFLYVGEPDSSGEHPILAVDPEDPCFVCVEYPGIDVFLAERARLVERTSGEFGGLDQHEVFAPRMNEHKVRLFGGARSLRYGDPGFSPTIATDVDPGATRLLPPGEEVPAGYRVVEEIENPMFGGRLRLIAPVSSG